MKRLVIMLIVMSTYIGLVSCSPEVVQDETKLSEGCCDNEGEIPPPPPPPPPGEGG